MLAISFLAWYNALKATGLEAFLMIARNFAAQFYFSYYYFNVKK
jgi:hypothetical protein